MGTRTLDMSGASACLAAVLLAACQTQPPASATPEPTVSRPPSSTLTQRLDPTRTPTGPPIDEHEVVDHRDGDEKVRLGFALEATLFPLSGNDGWLVHLDGDDVQVTARAGEFAGCLRINVVGGAGWGTYRWLCPGVGYVRSESYKCYGTGPNYVEVHELVRWTIPEW